MQRSTSRYRIFERAPTEDRIAAASPIRPADRLVAGYNAILSVVWLTQLADAPFAIWIFAAHAAAVCMPWLIARSADRLSPVGRELREIYPFLWIVPLWLELDFLRGFLHQTAYDRAIVALDLAVFRVHLDAVWMPSAPAVWFSELMHVLYFAYYPTVVLPILFVWVARRSEALRDMAFRVTLVYLACYLVYLAFPVDGPHFLRTQYSGPLNDGFFYWLVRQVQDSGDSMGCSFPSSHVAASATMALLGRRWFPPATWALLVAAAIGVMVSCVYTQNHYAIDSLAGLIWALALQLWLAPLLLRRWGQTGGLSTTKTAAATSESDLPRSPYRLPPSRRPLQ